MNEDHFHLLTSAYLDGEISPEELSQLENEIASNDIRREQFEQQKRINQALAIAFSTGAVTLAEQHLNAQPQPRKRRRRSAPLRKPSEVIYLDTHSGDISFTGHGAKAGKDKTSSSQPWWSYIGAAAACLIIGAFTLMPLLQQGNLTNTSNQSNALANIREVPTLGTSEALVISPLKENPPIERRQKVTLTASANNSELEMFSESVELLPQSDRRYILFQQQDIKPLIENYLVQPVHYQSGLQSDLLPEAPIRARFFGSGNPHVNDFRIQHATGNIVR